MPIAKSYYEILEIPNDSCETEIRTAYRKIIRRYHPDLNPDKKKSEKRTRQLNVALEVLTNPVQRRRYDKKLEGMGKAKANKEFEPDDRTGSWAEASPAAYGATESAREDRYESTSTGNTLGAVEAPLTPMFNFYPTRNAKGELRKFLINLIVCILATLLSLAVWCLMVNQIRRGPFDSNDADRVDGRKHFALASPQASIDESSNKVQLNELALNPAPKVSDTSTNSSPHLLIPPIKKSGPHPPPGGAKDPLPDDTEVPAVSSSKVRFAKLKEFALEGLTKTENGNLARQSLKLLDDAKIDNDPSLVKQISELALISARKSNDQRLIRQATLAVISAASIKPLAGEKLDE